jgi:hypothetical protein
MNDDIDYMIEVLGQPKSVEPAPETGVRELTGTVSENYILLLQKFGRCNWADGRLQLIAPPDLQPVVDLVLGEDQNLGGDGNAFAFAYTPFGQLHFWHKTYGAGEIDLVRGQVYCQDLTDPDDTPAVVPFAAMDVPFSMPPEDIDYFDQAGKPLFSKARKKLGEIGFLECYAFVPALAFGGEASVDNLKKNPAPEHFAILAQASEFTLMRITENFSYEEVRPIG